MRVAAHEFTKKSPKRLTAESLAKSVYVFVDFYTDLRKEPLSVIEPDMNPTERKNFHEHNIGNRVRVLGCCSRGSHGVCRTHGDRC